MIYPMIDSSFLPYGKIEPPHTGYPENFQQIPLWESDHLELYRFDHETSWDYCSGMTVLLIQDEENLRLFYLDRHVTIRAGVCFGFFPMAQESSITGDGALLAEAYRADTLPVPQETAQISPLKVFTIFHQTGLGGLYFRGEQHLPAEFVYLEKGLLHNLCGGQDLVLHPKELLLFGPDQWHMQYADEDVQFLTISFTWASHDFSSCMDHVISASPDIQRAVQDVLLEYTQRPPDWEESIHARLKLLLLQLLRNSDAQKERKKPSPISESVHRNIVNQAMKFVSMNIQYKLTVPQLAAAVNVSASQLTALFRTYLGVSPAKYITRVRLKESKVLLATGQMSVGEVAAHLGYTSIQHFSKQFHDWTGCTPTAYIKTTL